MLFPIEPTFFGGSYLMRIRKKLRKSFRIVLTRFIIFSKVRRDEIEISNSENFPFAFLNLINNLICHGFVSFLKANYIKIRKITLFFTFIDELHTINLYFCYIGGNISQK
jgi:hypothetical protein